MKLLVLGIFIAAAVAAVILFILCMIDRDEP